MLGSINLSEFVTKEKKFDTKAFEYAVEQGVIALNEVLDEGIELHALKEQRDMARDYRNIGLGFFGLSDALIKMEIVYGSEDSIKLCDMIGHVMANKALQTSSLIAKEKGVYPKYDEEAILKSKYLNKVATKKTMDMIKENGISNVAILTIPPTGSTGTMLSTGTALEPHFLLSYTRKTESLHGEDVFYKVFVKSAEDYMKKHGLTEEEQLPEWFVTSQNINWKDRVAMQSVWQKYIDASISSTVNLPNEATVEDVKNIYMEAWKQGLKGITIYRSGCKREGILTSGEAKVEEVELKRGEIEEMPDDTIYHKRRLNIGCGSLNMFVGFSESEQKIHDFYVVKKGSGGCSSNITAIAISMSTILRLGGNLNTIEDSIKGISGCTSFAVNRSNTSKGNTCASAILNVLKEFKKDEVQVKVDKPISKTTGNLCPQCNEPLQASGGCFTCVNCAYSKCN